MNRPWSLSVLWLLSMILISCINGQPEVELIYSNNFDFSEEGSSETDSKATYSQYKTEYFAGDSVLGRFGFDNLTMSLSEVPQYDFIEIAFDINIHDNWGGNGIDQNSGLPDIFIFNIDGFNIQYSTMVNTGCQGQDCEGTQSYPDPVGNQNPENADAIRTDLPGVCHFSEELGGSKKFRYKKRFNQSGPEIEFFFGAQLTHVTRDDYCLKSWSLDNIEVIGIKIPEIG